MSDSDSRGGPALPLVLKDTSCFPSDCKCPICSKAFNGAFAAVNGGAMLVEDGVGNMMGASGSAFLHLIWHGAHSDLEKNVHDDVYAGVEVVEEAANGQFDLYFCSTTCLRAFFNGAIDKLEQNVEGKRKHAHLLSIGDPEALRLEAERMAALEKELDESGVFEKLEALTLAKANENAQAVATAGGESAASNNTKD